MYVKECKEKPRSKAKEKSDLIVLIKVYSATLPGKDRWTQERMEMEKRCYNIIIDWSKSLKLTEEEKQKLQDFKETFKEICAKMVLEGE